VVTEIQRKSERHVAARAREDACACGASKAGATGICAACGAMAAGPLAAGGAGSGDAARGAVLHVGLAAALAIIAAIVFIATLPGCASAPPAPPPPPRPVPSLVGQMRLDAEELLARAGLRAHYSYRYAELDMDLVVDQSPEAGVPLAPSVPVEVVIATKSPR
jgi:hypothetical protein